MNHEYFLHRESQGEVFEIKLFLMIISNKYTSLILHLDQSYNENVHATPTTDSGNKLVFHTLIDSCSQYDRLRKQTTQLLGVHRIKSTHQWYNSGTNSLNYFTYLNIKNLSENTISENELKLDA